MLVPKKLFLDTLMPGGMSDASLSLSGTDTVGSITITKTIRTLSSVLTVGRFEVADGIDVI
jgi:hypothetical protein